MANLVVSWSDICWWVGSGSRGSFRDQGFIIWLLHLLRSPVKSSPEDCQPREQKELEEVRSAFHHYGRVGSLGNTLWDEDLCSGRFWGSTMRIKPVKELGFPGGAVVESLPANAGDTGSRPGLGRSHMPRSSWAREPQLLSLRVWSLCSAIRDAATVRGPRNAMKSGPRLPQLEKALAQKRRPNTAKNKINK